ncbi:hypothetical protein Pint_07004 [Pistacia integerrima]|uniref:Uncharacterized protein n=1 Tax=Pistacia integerrima TaxID=434235 RepID=A0ACC0XT26_9ROSI|nr:hypothetical protein Pint_07004 [Pistacia integerrima]
MGSVPLRRCYRADALVQSHYRVQYRRRPLCSNRLLVARTDTTLVTAEWAMSLPLNHPVVLKKARAELDHHVGLDHLAEEPDLVKLPYLQ